MAVPDFLTSLWQCASVPPQQHGLMAGMFLAGLLGSGTHCALMCGPFVLAQQGALDKPRGIALVPYHLGRITTYALLGVLLAATLRYGVTVPVAHTALAAPMLLLAGLLFLVAAFPRLGIVFPWVAKIRWALPRQILTFAMGTLTRDRSLAARFALGMVLGLMPCGLVLAAVLAAGATADPALAGFGMLAFGAGTLPALLLIGLGGRSLQVRYPALAQLAAPGMILGSGLWLLALAGMMLS